MIHLRSIQYKKPLKSQQNSFPFSMPLINSLNEIHFPSQVTFFVGENGTGKSTILEAIAAAVGSITVGGENINSDKTLMHSRNLAKQFKLIWRKKNHQGFFLRAEDFFNFAKKLSKMRAEMQERLHEIDEEYQDRSVYARNLAKMPYTSSLRELENRYGEDLDANSHGESFLKLFESRFVPNGLYLLDEPEAPLSPTRQLAFLVMLKEMVRQKSQFIIATHSPMILAFPEATILSFDNNSISLAQYDDLEHVRLTKAFLNNPEQYLRHL